MHTVKHRSSSLRAFTLIELLVVVAILAVLMALLFPAFRAVRCQAHGIVCMSNLRSIATDFNYIADNPPSIKKLFFNNYSANVFGLTSFIDRVYGTGAYSPTDENGNPVDHDTPFGAPGQAGVYQCPAAYQNLTVTPHARVLEGAVQPATKTNLAFFARLFEVWRETPSGNTERHYVSLGRHIFNSWQRAAQIPLVLDADVEKLGPLMRLASPHLTAPAVEPFGPYSANSNYVYGRRYFPSGRHCGKFNVALLDTSVHSFPADSDPRMHALVNWSDAQYDGHWDQYGNYQGPGDMQWAYISDGSLASTLVY